MLTIFGWSFEIEERCKGVHYVDLGESFPTRIYLQKSASIQPRTSPSKFGGKFNSLFICLLRTTPSNSPAHGPESTRKVMSPCATDALRLRQGTQRDARMVG